jgi:hypothetical protein
MSRSQLRAIITKHGFTRLAIWCKIIYPFTQAVKFFEQDYVTLCHVYLALKTLKGYFEDEERSQCDSNPEYAMCCSTALSVIHQARCKLLDQDLPKAAFWLTSSGCQSLPDNAPFIRLPYRLDLEYHAPCLIPNAHEPLDGIRDNVHRSQDFDEQRSDEVHDAYPGNVIMEEEPEEGSKIWRCKTRF